jgi:glucokinase
MQSKYVIGIDLGGTKIHGAISDFEGNIIFQKIISTCAQDGEKAVLNNIINLIDYIIKESNVQLTNIEAIGVGSPGPLDVEKGVIIKSPNLPFNNFDILTPIQTKFNVPSYLQNDANVAVIGEYLFGQGREYKNVIYITVSTGIGAGAIIDGKIYNGSTYNSLEFGHTVVDLNGPICGCGNRGCIEAIASGTGIARLAMQKVNNCENTSLKKYEKITAKEVFFEAEQGDRLAKDIVDNSLTYLGVSIANLITLFDPQIVIIGGGVAKTGDYFFNKIRSIVKEKGFYPSKEFCKIVPSTLDGNSGVIGAIALAIIEYNKNK